jgi:NAD(P)-dependent dehydrogenase (short-subunit alcohol dehydrogenase family)
MGKGASSEKVVRWIDTAVTRHGRVDVLYNNAALTLFVAAARDAAVAVAVGDSRGSRRALRTIHWCSAPS